MLGLCYRFFFLLLFSCVSYDLSLFQMEESEEIVWASALSCLFYFVCDNGKILRSRLAGLDIRVRTFEHQIFLITDISLKLNHYHFWLVAAGY